MSRVVLYSDPPEHSTLRRLLAPATSASSLASVIARMPEILRPIARGLEGGGEFDAVTDLAAPMAAGTLSRLLDFDLEDDTVLARHSQSLSKCFSLSPSADELSGGERAVEALAVAAHRAVARSPVLAEIAERGRNAGLDPETVTDNMVFLFFAGFETTAAMIGNAISWLLADPARQDRLRAAAGHAGEVVEAALRHDPPIQGVSRVARETVRVAGRELRPGRVLVLFLASANLDGEELMSFGAGRHRCPGAELARAEIGTVLEWVAGAPGPLVATGLASRSANGRIRCYNRLPVRFKRPVELTKAR